jgi:hypothetical protein
MWRLADAPPRSGQLLTVQAARGPRSANSSRPRLASVVDDFQHDETLTVGRDSIRLVADEPLRVEWSLEQHGRRPTDTVSPSVSSTAMTLRTVAVEELLSSGDHTGSLPPSLDIVTSGPSGNRRMTSARDRP